jgi:hypothetical protein
VKTAEIVSRQYLCKRDFTTRATVKEGESYSAHCHEFISYLHASIQVEVGKAYVKILQGPNVFENTTGYTMC